MPNVRSGQSKEVRRGTQSYEEVRRGTKRYDKKFMLITELGFIAHDVEVGRGDSKVLPKPGLGRGEAASARDKDENEGNGREAHDAELWKQHQVAQEMFFEEQLPKS